MRCINGWDDEMVWTIYTIGGWNRDLQILLGSYFAHVDWRNPIYSLYHWFVYHTCEEILIQLLWLAVTGNSGFCVMQIIVSGVI